MVGAHAQWRCVWYFYLLLLLLLLLLRLRHARLLRALLNFYRETGGECGRVSGFACVSQSLQQHVG